MAATLADSLSIVLPDLPTALVPAQARPHLIDLARRLAPVPRCGFEIRLGHSQEVDFQQGILASEDEVQRLRSHLSRAGGHGLAWGRLDALLADWDDPSSPLHDEIEDLWLEFDRPPAAALSVFVGFPRRPAPPAHRLRFAQRALDLLAGRHGWSLWRTALERCFYGCPEGALISHVGLMIGRPSPVLRVNVKRVEPDQIGEFLQHAGWREGVDEPVELGRRLRAHFEPLTVCLDLGAQGHEKVGFECFVGPRGAEAWKPSLEWLVEQGWCTPAKRDALLTWPRIIGPSDAGHWPADLVGSGLRRPADHFTLFERQLSHVKVAYEPGRPTEAKGYFGFIHHWQRPELVRDRPSLGVGKPTRRNGAAQPVADATEFLLASRTRAGWWLDFAGTIGATEDWEEGVGWSDEWVTAFVGTALSRTRDPRALQACRRAWDLMVERRAPVPGWGYNRILPVDADSTAWALQLAATAGASNTQPARRARQALQLYERSDGGVSSYRETDRIRPGAERQQSPDGSSAGWCSTSHACVTGAAVLAGHDRGRKFLRSAQRPDGSWASYWWDEDSYATALAAEGLASTGSLEDRRQVSLAVKWALGRLGPDGVADDSPFATAWCVRILRLDGDATEARVARDRAVAWLVDRQEPDGGWPASALLRAPRPDVTHPDSSPLTPMSTLDEQRTFTTATVLSALAGSER